MTDPARPLPPLPALHAQIMNIPVSPLVEGWAMAERHNYKMGHRDARHAAAELVAAATASDAALLRDMAEALAFYADPTRYHGPNQRLDEPDPWSERVGLSAYRLDVTRDGGSIAAAALRAYKEKHK